MSSAAQNHAKLKVCFVEMEPDVCWNIEHNTSELKSNKRNSLRKSKT